MISLVKYELYKLIKNRSIMGVLLLLFLLYLLFTGMQVNSEMQKNPVEIYKNVYAEIKDMKTDDILPYLDEKKQQYSWEELGYIDERLWQYREVYGEAEKVLLYEQFLDKIAQAEKKYSSVGIFAKKDGYVIKNIKKTAAVYEKLEGTVLPVEASKGVTGVLNSTSLPLFLLASMFVSVVFLFQLDRNTGIELVERTTVRGRAQQMTAKVLTMMVLAFVFLIAFVSVNITIYGIIYGFGNLLRPIQSVQGFLGCPYSISVLGFFVITMLTKWLALLVSGLIFAVICLKTRKAGVAFFIAAVMIVVMACCFKLINDASIFVYIKYVNLFTLLESSMLYANYRNLKIFGQPVSAVTCLWYAVIVICVTLLIYVIFKGRKKRNYSNRKKRERIMLFKPIPNMFCQVAYKMLVYGRSIIIIVIGAVVVLGAYSKYPVYLSLEEEQYRAYMNKFAGPYTEETKEMVEAEEKRFADLRQTLFSLAMDYESGNIDSQTYSEKQAAINSELLIEVAFIRTKYNLERISNIEGAENVYDTGYNLLLSEKNLMLISYLIIVILLLTVIAENTVQERLSGMQDLTYATVNGRKVLKRHELIIYELCGLVICIVAFGGEIMFAAKNYGLSNLSANVSSLASIQGGGDYSILLYIFFFYLKKILVVELLIALFVVGMEKVKNLVRK